jgi:hypothetical protein
MTPMILSSRSFKLLIFRRMGSYYLGVADEELVDPHSGDVGNRGDQEQVDNLDHGQRHRLCSLGRDITRRHERNRSGENPTHPHEDGACSKEHAADDR